MKNPSQNLNKRGFYNDRQLFSSKCKECSNKRERELAEQNEFTETEEGIWVNGKLIIDRECTRCIQIKNIFDFKRDKRREAGRSSWCKDCHKGQGKEYREKVPYTERRNLDKENAKKKRFREKYPAKLAAQARRSYYKDVDRTRRLKREGYQKNKERYTLANLKRRAFKHGLPKDFTKKKESEVLEYFGSACALTGRIDDISFDHFIPLSWGYGGTILENMLPLNRSLNINKSDKNPFEWIKEVEVTEQIDINLFYRTVEYFAILNDKSVKEFEEYVYQCEKNKRIIVDGESYRMEYFVGRAFNINERPKKVCSKCGEEKDLLDFHVQKSGRFGRNSRCKPCAISDAVISNKKVRERKRNSV